MNLNNTNRKANDNSASIEFGKIKFSNSAAKKNEKYLNGTAIFIIPLKLRKGFRKYFANVSRTKIAINNAGKITAVVSKKGLSKLYSVQRDRNESIIKKGFGIIFCVTHINSNNTIYINIKKIVIFEIDEGLFGINLLVLIYAK